MDVAENTPTDADVMQARAEMRKHYEDIDLSTSVSFVGIPFAVNGGVYSDIYMGNQAKSDAPDAQNTSQVAIKAFRAAVFASATPAEKLKYIKVLGDLEMAEAEKALTLVQQMRKEVSVWRRVKHPNIHPLLGLWWHDTWPLPAMISVWESDGNLIAYIAKLPPATTAIKRYDIKMDLLEGVLDGLVYLHSEEIIHADLKGENVLIAQQDGQPRPQLCDFGLSWTSIKISITFSLRRTSGGTRGFMAPELLLSATEAAGSSVPYSYASDVWAFGSLFCQIIAGTEPTSPTGLLTQPENMDKLHWDLVQRCCATSAEERPTAVLALDALKKLRASRGQDPLAEPSPLSAASPATDRGASPAGE